MVDSIEHVSAEIPSPSHTNLHSSAATEEMEQIQARLRRKRLSQSRPAMSQEKLMLGIMAIFFIGVLLYAVLPEGMVRIMGMSLFTVGLVYFLRKCGW